MLVTMTPDQMAALVARPAEYIDGEPPEALPVMFGVVRGPLVVPDAAASVRLTTKAGPIVRAHWPID